MKTIIHFLPWLAHLFLEWEMFETEVVGEIKTYILRAINFFFENFPFFFFFFLGNEEKFCRAWGSPQTTIKQMRIACWISKATGTHNV